MDIYSLIHRWGRACLHCASYFAGDSLLCLSCERLLWNRHGGCRFVETEKSLTVHSLFYWEQDQDRQVSKLMVTLKEGQPAPAFRYYAEQFYMRFLDMEISQEAILVPCASKFGRQHAHIFAQKLSEVFDVPVQDVLQWKGKIESQKTKRKSRRQEVEFVPTKALQGRRVIFIDDIFTTGATAAAAHRALQGCSGFEVWCLARRAP